MKMSVGMRIYGLPTSNSPVQKSEDEADVSCAKSRKLITGIESLRSKTSTASCFASARIRPVHRNSLNETRIANGRQRKLNRRSTQVDADEDILFVCRNQKDSASVANRK